MRKLVNGLFGFSVKFIIKVCENVVHKLVKNCIQIEVFVHKPLFTYTEHVNKLRYYAQLIPSFATVRSTVCEHIFYIITSVKKIFIHNIHIANNNNHY